MAAAKSAETTSPTNTQSSAEAAVPVLERTNLKQLEHARADFVALVPHPITPDEILHPKFWSIAAAYLRPFSRIEARAENGEWISELVVLSTARTFAIVRRLQHYRLTTEDVAATQLALAETTAYRIEYRGQINKFCVLDGKGDIVHKGEETQQAADAWLAAHQKAMRR